MLRDKAVVKSVGLGFEFAYERHTQASIVDLGSPGKVGLSLPQDVKVKAS